MRAFFAALLSAGSWVSAAHAAAGPEEGWLPWIVIGALALFVLGIAIRMFVAARFPKGYRQWAASRREAFGERNEAWDRDDEEFRR